MGEGEIGLRELEWQREIDGKIKGGVHKEKEREREGQT